MAKTLNTKYAHYLRRGKMFNKIMEIFTLIAFALSIMILLMATILLGAEAAQYLGLI